MSHRVPQETLPNRIHVLLIESKKRFYPTHFALLHLCGVMFGPALKSGHQETCGVKSGLLEKSSRLYLACFTTMNTLSLSPVSMWENLTVD